MLLVTKRDTPLICSGDLAQRILHIFTAQIRNATLGDEIPRNAAPFVLDFTEGQWAEAIQEYSPDSQISHFAQEDSEEYQGRWIVGDFDAMSEGFEGSFDWVLGDEKALASIPQAELIRGALKLLREGGWLGLYLPMNYMIFSPLRYRRKQLIPHQLWVSAQTLVTKPYALHIWQKGRPFEASLIEWFE